MKKFRRIDPTKIQSRSFASLNITCGSTSCSTGLHCFSRYVKKAIKQHGKEGVCYECGEDSIDWKRVHKNNIADTKFVFTSLKKELIRFAFFNVKINKYAIENAVKSNKTEIRTEAEKLLNTRIKKYNSFIDNRQTPLGKNNIINYAQHGTATCCRVCLEKWHGIPKKQELTDDQLKYCTDLVMKFVEERIPNLK